MLINCKTTGFVGGDLNCIIRSQDATNNPNSKMSSCLSRLTKSFLWTDSFLAINPHMQAYSRFYDIKGVVGASRIDRQYHWGAVAVLNAEYKPVAFSDHFALITKVKVPNQICKMVCPKSRPIYKITDEVARDSKFQASVKSAMDEWICVKDNGLNIFQWWDLICKPGIRRIAMERSKSLSHERKSLLNLLLLRQTYLVNKIRNSSDIHWSTYLAQLSSVQTNIQDWYFQAAEKVKVQSQVQ